MFVGGVCPFATMIARTLMASLPTSTAWQPCPMTPLGENFVFCLRHWAEFERVCVRRLDAVLGYSVEERIRQAADSVFRAASDEAIDFLRGAGARLANQLTRLGACTPLPQKRQTRYNKWQVRYECRTGRLSVRVGLTIVKARPEIIAWIRRRKGGKAGQAVLHKILAGHTVPQDPHWRLKNVVPLKSIPIPVHDRAIYAEPLIEQISAAFTCLAQLDF